MQIRFLNHLRVQLLVFVVVIAVVPGRAGYLVADTNNSIQYIGTKWSLLTPSTDPWMTGQAVYDATLMREPGSSSTRSPIDNSSFDADSDCGTADDCHLFIPVIGSGITIYNVIKSSVNVSITVDGGLPTFFSFVDDGSCLNATNPGCFNYSIYTNQALAYGTHNVDIAMFTVSPSITNLSNSEFYFNYAVVNDTSTIISLPPSITSAAPGGSFAPTASVTSTNMPISPTQSKSPHKRFPRPDIAAIVIISCFLVFVVWVLYWCISRPRFTKLDPDGYPDTTPLPDITPTPPNAVRQDPGSTLTNANPQGPAATIPADDPSNAGAPVHAVQAANS